MFRVLSVSLFARWIPSCNSPSIIPWVPRPPKNIFVSGKALDNFDGCKVIDEREDGHYSTPVEAEGKDETFISRIREDKTIKNGLNLWIVSDNLRKGAATNTIQIAEYLIHNNIV